MEAAKEIEILTAERELYASAMNRMKAAASSVTNYPAQIKQDISAPQAQQPIIQTQIVKDISEKPCHSCAHHD
jgi:hypothetical protein